MLLHKLPSFFRAAQNKRFEYKPLVYDEVKERIERRRKELQQEKDAANNEGSIPLRSMQKGWVRRGETQHAKRQSNLRLLVIIALLSLLAYYLLRMA